MAKHWTPSDFIVTCTTPAYDGSSAVNQYGYCQKCLGDMQAFGGNGEAGKILHYTSHNTARRLKLWGVRTNS